LVSSLGLHLGALGGDLGGARFSDSSQVEQRLEKTRQIMQAAAELRVPVVTTSLGLVTAESLKSGFLKEALRHLAEVSDRTGTRLAIETGGDPQAMSDLLKELGNTGLGACYDPASLIIEGFDPLSGIDPFADHILVAHVRDGTAGSDRRPGRETPLGQGQIDFPKYLAALDQSGFHGVPYLRRTTAERPLQDITDDKARLDSLIR
jgi:sugar phosphate isomerase/epimerase